MREIRLGEPDSELIGRLTVAENLLLAMVTVVAGLNVIGWLLPIVGRLLKGGWSAMSAEAAVASLLTVLSLLLARSDNGMRLRAVSIGLAAITAVGSAMELANHLASGHPLVIFRPASWDASGMTLDAAGCFTLLGVSIAFSRMPRFFEILADLCTFFLIFSVAVLVAGQLIGLTHVFGPNPTFAIAGGTAFCLLLLSLVLFFQKAETGLFSILLGRGIGSKVARFLTPLVLLGPYLRETVRARILETVGMPRHYLAALLATMAVVLGIAILLYLAWRLNALEAETQGLSLRDALTGLYNLRGFRLLSEQSLLLARRSAQPFSVLFIDIDNLKVINDALGHQTGSELLASTAQILREAFRESDVLGRIGGDEFAVAGQFDQAAIAEAVERLRQSAKLYNANASKSTLRFSAGWATCTPDIREPLGDLLARADAAMYSEKRSRKASAAKSRLTPDAAAQTGSRDSGHASGLREVG